jgi:signal transduction histidine kinase
LKLITKATSYLFAGYVVVMITGAVFLYFTFKVLVYKQIDRSLVEEKNIIQEQIEETDTIPDFKPAMRRQIEVRLLEKTERYSEVFRDTAILDEKSGNYNTYRYLTFTSNTASGTGYSIKIIRPLDEMEELFKDIALYLFYLFLSILMATILVNYLVTKRLWNPFYQAVRKASSFNVQTDKSLDLPKSDTDEFSQLNNVINQMTERMKRDYLNLKEFNEDASHEIQTPLAIIRSKMEILMQNRDLRKEDIENIKTINEATDRLLKLNQGLLLISKIENNYFQNMKEVSLRLTVIKYLNNYSEIIHIKNISTEVTGSDSVFVEMDEILADTLISNLISNAVRYNIKGGFIKCHTEQGSIIIMNTGIPLEVEPELLFKRFRKGGNSQQSVGLGLSIVKKIADNYGIAVKYSCTENIHEVKLTITL